MRNIFNENCNRDLYWFVRPFNRVHFLFSFSFIFYCLYLTILFFILIYSDPPLGPPHMGWMDKCQTNTSRWWMINYAYIWRLHISALSGQILMYDHVATISILELSYTSSWQYIMLFSWLDILFIYLESYLMYDDLKICQQQNHLNVMNQTFNFNIKQVYN